MNHIKSINEKLYHDIDDLNLDNRKYTPDENLFNTIKGRLLTGFEISWSPIMYKRKRYEKIVFSITIKPYRNIINHFYIDIHPLDDEYFDIEYLDTRDKSYGKTIFNSVFYRCDGVEGLIEFLVDEEIIKPDMKNIKLFEAFKKEDYTKAFNHIKSLLNSETNKEDIIKYIDAFNGDVAKEINNLRLIIERTQREFNTRYTHYHFYNRSTKTSRKRTDGSDHAGSWKAGDTVKRDSYNMSRYYIFPKTTDVSFSNRNRDKHDQETARKFLELQKNQYQQIIGRISHLNITRIKFFCDRFFEIMDWVVETGPDKLIIKNSQDSDDEVKKTQLEELNEFDMENEYDEINKISKRVGVEIQNLINTL